MDIDISLLIFTTIAALWSVMARSLLRAAIALSFTSAMLAVLMFRLEAPLAAVFELSVCAGLITVLFVSVISLTQPLTREQVLSHMKERMRRFVFLPFIVTAVGLALSQVKMCPGFRLPLPESVRDVRVVLWNLRSLDVIGQVLMILGGVIGVVMLFKENQKK